MESKIIKKWKSNFLTIAIFPSLLMSLESKNGLTVTGLEKRQEKKNGLTDTALPLDGDNDDDNDFDVFSQVLMSYSIPCSA